jgi:Cysteine-rich CWC
VNDASPCDCTTIDLSEALKAELREKFVGCLCLACLRELAAADDEDLAARLGASIGREALYEERMQALERRRQKTKRT